MGEEFANVHFIFLLIQDGKCGRKEKLQGRRKGGATSATAQGLCQLGGPKSGMVYYNYASNNDKQNCFGLVVSVFK